MLTLSVISTVSTVITGLTTTLKFAKTAMLGLNLAMRANPIELWNKLGFLKGAVIAMLGPFGQIVVAGIAIYKKFDTIKSKAGDMVNSVVIFGITILKTGLNVMKDLWLLMERIFCWYLKKLS
ncbi:hypothetical protein [Peribacillus butanolivorans]|uniref:hypothetical protein n=1 Tax=Peribacillus butanolivorans TaxID=421767 RepID=UPI0036739D48